MTYMGPRLDARRLLERETHGGEVVAAEIHVDVHFGGDGITMELLKVVMASWMARMGIELGIEA